MNTLLLERRKEPTISAKKSPILKDAPLQGGANNVKIQVSSGRRQICNVYLDSAMGLSWAMGEAVIIHNY